MQHGVDGDGGAPRPFVQHGVDGDGGAPHATPPTAPLPPLMPHWMWPEALVLGSSGPDDATAAAGGVPPSMMPSSLLHDAIRWVAVSGGDPDAMRMVETLVDAGADVAGGAWREEGAQEVEDAPTQCPLLAALLLEQHVALSCGTASSIRPHCSALLGFLLRHVPAEWLAQAAADRGSSAGRDAAAFLFQAMFGGYHGCAAAAISLGFPCHADLTDPHTGDTLLTALLSSPPPPATSVWYQRSVLGAVSIASFPDRTAVRGALTATHRALFTQLAKTAAAAENHASPQTALLHQPNRLGHTPLFLAACHSDLPLVEQLLMTFKASATTVTTNGVGTWRPLAAMCYTSESQVPLILRVTKELSPASVRRSWIRAVSHRVPPMMCLTIMQNYPTESAQESISALLFWLALFYVSRFGDTEQRSAVLRRVFEPMLFASGMPMAAVVPLPASSTMVGAASSANATAASTGVGANAPMLDHLPPLLTCAFLAAR